MTDRIPNDLLAMLGGPGATPNGLDPMQMGMVPPAPEYGMSMSDATGQQESASTVPGSWGMPPDPTADQSIAPSFDQTLSQMLMSPPPIKVQAKKRNLGPRVDEDTVREIARAQELRYGERNIRIGRDIALYNQDVNFVPSDFDPRHDTPFVSPFIPTLVNKLSSMLSAPEPRLIIPFDSEDSKQAAQAKENFGYWARKQDRKFYGRSGGGSLQWDEFFYLLLHGFVVARILPDPDDEVYPFHFSLIDPSQCYPIFKGDKHGLDTMVRCYRSTVMDMVNTYGFDDPNLERRLKKAAGYEQSDDLRSFFQTEGNVIEYWDRRQRCVLWNDATVMPVTEHNMGFCPFVVASAKGQPKGMNTPYTKGSSFIDEYNNTGYGPSRGHDLANKSVSVFHHLIHTNRIREVVHTIYLMEIEKALNPPTITYVAPQYSGQNPPPLNLKKKGNNVRLLNFMKVEAVPTSPRPTDASPLINIVGSDLADGGLPPLMHGNESGSNVSGFAVESLIAVAKDVTLPYTQAFETYLAQVTEMKLELYDKFILPVNGPLSVPQRGSYGHTPLTELTIELMNLTDNDVEVKLWAMSQQMLPGQINAAAMAVQAGIWSLRKAMEHTGSLDPDRDFQDIITERAIQHPEIMENILIPRAFMAQGNPQLAEFWNASVVMPKMQAMMMGGMPGGPEGGPGQPPAAGPQPNGQSLAANRPDAGMPGGGGPLPGEGRGPSRE